MGSIMKMGLKSYLVFTSLLYRIVMYVLLPIVLAGIYIYLEKYISVEASMIVIAELLTAAEIISDNWMFGGIQAKDSAKLDFLKTSGRGMKIMKNALAMDLFRKFLSAAGILVLCSLALTDGMVLDIWTVIYLLLVSYFFSVFGMLISRFFTLLWCNMLTSYVANFLAILCCVLPGLPEKALWYDMLFAILGIGISILAVNMAMKRVKAQYIG